jgi:hypothetical protein
MGDADMQGIEPYMPARDLLAFLFLIRCWHVVPFRLVSKGTTSALYVSLNCESSTTPGVGMS